MHMTVRKAMTVLVAGVGAALFLLPGSTALAEQSQAQAGFEFSTVEDAYAMEYGVTIDEADRRLKRIQPMQAELLAIREAEHGRLAGWGIDHGEPMTGWVLLTGDEPARGPATQLADDAADIELQFGVAYTADQLQAASERLTAARIIWVAAINYCDAAWVDEAYLPGAGGPASAPPSRQPLDAFPDDFPDLGLPSGFDITQILLAPGMELFVGVDSPSADPAEPLISSMQEAGWTIVDWALLSNGLTSIGLEHTASGITGALSVYPGADGSTIFGTWLLPG